MSEPTIDFVTGTLLYRERIALPPDATIVVELAYHPPEGEEPAIIGLDTFTSGGKQAPFDFSVPYERGEIDGRRNYFLQARIEHESGKFCFQSGEPVNVITRDHPVSDVMIMLHQCPVETRTAQVGGLVQFRDAAELQPGWLLIVRLQDVSRADAPAIVLGEQITKLGDEQPPLPFAINYDPGEIDERFVYSLAARIEDSAGILRYINDTHTPVITRGAPTEEVDIWVRRI
ncbi:MAG: YbaY family lipoprotein [Candidatus Promineifilaceae bacterium]